MQNAARRADGARRRSPSPACSPGAGRDRRRRVGVHRGVGDAEARDWRRVRGGGDAEAPATTAAAEAFEESPRRQPRQSPAASDGGLFGAGEGTGGHHRRRRGATRHASRGTCSRTTATASSSPPRPTRCRRSHSTSTPASYTLLRRWLHEGTLPPIDVGASRGVRQRVRLRLPGAAPRASTSRSTAARRRSTRDRYLVRVGVQGEVVDDADRGAARAHVRRRHVGIDGPRRPARAGEAVARGARRRSSTTTTRSRSSRTTTRPAWCSPRRRCPSAT